MITDVKKGDTGWQNSLPNDWTSPSEKKLKKKIVRQTAKKTQTNHQEAS